MTLKIPIKLVLLLFGVSAIFAVALIVLNHWETERATLAVRDEEVELASLLDKIVQLTGNPLKSYVVDYSHWDEMVRFVAQPDTAWVKVNLGQSMPLYSIDAAWVFDPKMQLVYATNSLNNAYFLRDMPSYPEAKIEIREHSSLHYFCATSSGIMEMRSAAILPQSDTLEMTPPRGYFFIGKLWTSQYLLDLAKSTGGTLQVITVPQSLRNTESTNKDMIRVDKPLLDLNEYPVAILRLQDDSAFLEDFARLTRREAGVFITFTLCALIILAYSLKRWVQRPLALTTASLRSKNLAPLQSLMRYKNEFSDIASLIIEFFAQKTVLENEIKERTRIQTALTKSEERLLQWLDSLQEIVWVVDPQGRLLYLNEAAYKTLGYDKQELLGRTFDEFQLPRYAKKDIRTLSRVMAGEVLREYETEFLRKDGYRVAVSLSATQLLDTDGNVAGASGTGWDITKRNQIEGALAESEERFRTLVGNIPGVVYRCKADARRTMKYVSGEMQKLCGAPESEFIDNRVRAFVDIIVPEDLALVQNAIELAGTRREAFAVEYRVLTVEGMVKWVHDKGQPVFDSDGKLCCIDGVLLDITERKRVQEMMRDLEQRNRQILDSIADLVSVRDDAGKIVFANRTFLDFCGLTDEVFGSDARETIARATGESARSDAEVFRTGRSLDMPEETLKGFDAESRVFHTVRYPIRNDAGDVIAVVSVSRDITDRNLSEEAQRLSELYFRTMIENASDLITVVDAEGRFRYQSPAVKEILGYEHHELALKQCAEYVHPEDLQRVQEAFGNVLAGVKSSEHVRFRALGKDGTWVELECHGRAALDPQGMPVVVVISRNVGERVHIEESLRETQSYLQTVINSVQAFVLVIDDETKQIVDANTAALVFLGCSKDEILGADSYKFVALDGDVAAANACLASTCQNNALIQVGPDKVCVRGNITHAVLHEHPCTVVSFVDTDQRADAVRLIPGSNQTASHTV